MIESTDRSGRVSRWARRAVCLTALAVAAVAIPASAQAPTAPGTPPAPVPAAKPGLPVVPARMPDGKPNWSGFWVPPGGMLEVDFGPSGVTGRGVVNVPQPRTTDPNLKSPYKEKYEALQQAIARNELPDYSALCTPNGMPRMMGMLYGMEILQTLSTLAITSDYQGTTRRVWLDLKEHPPTDELEDTYAGHSIGHWEGDTLVVDTVGIREDVPIDGTRMPHSPKLRIVERLTQTSPGILVDEITIEDPDAFIKPIKQTRTYRHRPDLRLREYFCMDNNRNVDPQTGKPAFK